MAPFRELESEFKAKTAKKPGYPRDLPFPGNYIVEPANFQEES